MTCRRSLGEPEAFSAEAAAAIDWDEPWQRVVDGSRVPSSAGLLGGPPNTGSKALEPLITEGDSVFQGFQAMELAGLEPATSWVRCSGDRSRPFAPVR